MITDLVHVREPAIHHQLSSYLVCCELAAFISDPTHDFFFVGLLGFVIAPLLLKELLLPDFVLKFKLKLIDLSLK